jgi:hypothetical protein
MKNVVFWDIKTQFVPQRRHATFPLQSQMPSSGMWHRVALVRTDVSEERIASIIRVTRIGAVGTTLANLRREHSFGFAGY